MEMAASRKAPEEFVAAVAKRPARGLGKQAFADLWRKHRADCHQTSPSFAQSLRSRLQSRPQSQLPLGSIILLTQQGALARRGVDFKRSRIYDIPCTLMML